MSEIISLSEQRKKRDYISDSKSQSKQNIMSEKHGQMSISDEEMAGLLSVFSVVQKARVQPFTTKSDFAREFANEVALCASEGFITTQVDDSSFTNIWMVTHEGLSFMEGLSDVLGD